MNFSFFFFLLLRLLPNYMQKPGAAATASPGAHTHKTRRGLTISNNNLRHYANPFSLFIETQRGVDFSRNGAFPSCGAEPRLRYPNVTAAKSAAPPPLSLDSGSYAHAIVLCTRNCSMRVRPCESTLQPSLDKIPFLEKKGFLGVLLSSAGGCVTLLPSNTRKRADGIRACNLTVLTAIIKSCVPTFSSVVQNTLK